jgi:pimeloyl-ACP methyl ester carboxylesterase
VEQLTVQGHAGRPLRCVVDEGARGTAIVFPGAFYVPQAPLLWFAHECLAERGLGVVEVWWELPEEIGAEEAVELVHGHARAVAERWPPDVLVGKSLGTEAMASLGLDVPSIWLTPTLVREGTRRALAGVTAPALAVIGTNDPLAPRELWPQLSAPAELLEVEGADHGLRVGDPAGTAAVLARVVDAMRAFLERAL